MSSGGKIEVIMKKIIIRTEVYSRVSGYFRPISQWNRGKNSEFNDRKTLKLTNKILNNQIKIES